MHEAAEIPRREEIDRWGLRALPAFVEEDRGNIVFRAAGGLNYRNSSVTVFEPEQETADALLPEVEAFSERQGIEPVLRIVGEGGALAAQLLSRGWKPFRECLVMTAGGMAEPSSEIALSPKLREWPLEDWLSLQEGHKGLTGESRCLFHEIFSRLPANAHPVALDEPGPPATALLHHEGGWIGLMNMLVDPERRGQGIGRRCLDAVLATPARGLWLQVFTENRAAVRLYRTAGFEIAYPYSYWRRHA